MCGVLNTRELWNDNLEGLINIGVLSEGNSLWNLPRFFERTGQDRYFISLLDETGGKVLTNKTCSPCNQGPDFTLPKS